MKHFLIVFLLILSINEVSAKTPKKYKVHIVTWDKSKVTGRLEGITDSSISIRIQNGKLFTFSAEQTRDLKIWKRGINLPSAAAGCIVLTATFFTIAKREDALSRTIAEFYGITLGTIGGLVVGDLISSKYNKRKMHLDNFKALQAKLK